MRLAILGDIHGNLEALEAAVAEAARAGCEKIVHTGDLIGYGPRPNETIDLVRAKGITGVRGNFDENAAWGGEAPGVAGTAREVALAARAYRWTVDHLGYSQRNFLKDVPFSLEERIGQRVLAVFHASPTDLYTAIDERAPESALLALARETGAGVHVFGHTHRPYHRVVEGRHFVNAGSVGCPGDGDPRACVTILELDGAVRVEFRRVAYDVEKTARETEEAGLPVELAARVRTGS